MFRVRSDFGFVFGTHGPPTDILPGRGGIGTSAVLSISPELKLSASGSKLTIELLPVGLVVTVSGNGQIPSPGRGSPLGQLTTVCQAAGSRDGRAGAGFSLASCTRVAGEPSHRPCGVKVLMSLACPVSIAAPVSGVGDIETDIGWPPE